MEKLKTAYQYLLPQHALTRLVGKLAQSKNRFIKKALIGFFLKNFDINLSEAVIDNPDDFETFNDFFTRALKPGIRTIDSDPQRLVSPVDGVVSQSGDIIDGDIFQAKGHSFTLAELLGGNSVDSDLVDQYMDGTFSTMYLAPKDYHRIHMPVDASLKSMTYIPGRLFSVNPATVRTIPRLFARNERLVAHFETAFGPMAMVLVGATIVGSIETVWSGVVTPPRASNVRSWQYESSQHQFSKGEEMGRFLLGSTVILLFAKDKMNWMESSNASSPLKLGEAIATAC